MSLIIKSVDDDIYHYCQLTYDKFMTSASHIPQRIFLWGGQVRKFSGLLICMKNDKEGNKYYNTMPYETTIIYQLIPILVMLQTHLVNGIAQNIGRSTN